MTEKYNISIYIQIIIHDKLLIYERLYCILYNFKIDLHTTYTHTLIEYQVKFTIYYIDSIYIMDKIYVINIIHVMNIIYIMYTMNITGS